MARVWCGPVAPSLNMPGYRVRERAGIRLFSPAALAKVVLEGLDLRLDGCLGLCPLGADDLVVPARPLAPRDRGELVESLVPPRGLVLAEDRPRAHGAGRAVGGGVGAWSRPQVPRAAPHAGRLNPGLFALLFPRLILGRPLTLILPPRPGRPGRDILVGLSTCRGALSWPIHLGRRSTKVPVVEAVMAARQPDGRRKVGDVVGESLGILLGHLSLHFVCGSHQPTGRESGLLGGAGAGIAPALAAALLLLQIKGCANGAGVK
mmetsp:Transcript_50616/g.161992  ORF Transcript_50616/g.161992 Transcript_50616/m.161992 type:complete len:263 (+) Transcript_50616:92-880(+)